MNLCSSFFLNTSNNLLYPPPQTVFVSCIGPHYSAVVWMGQSILAECMLHVSQQGKSKNADCQVCQSLDRAESTNERKG